MAEQKVLPPRLRLEVPLLAKQLFRLLSTSTVKLNLLLRLLQFTLDSLLLLQELDTVWTPLQSLDDVEQHVIVAGVPVLVIDHRNEAVVSHPQKVLLASGEFTPLLLRWVPH